MDSMGKPPKHGFHKTEIHHHGDGSHTIHHHHVEPEKSISHAVPDHDSMMDSMQEHLGGGAPSPQESQMPTTAAMPAPGGMPA
jgi:hypothetical protein